MIFSSGTKKPKVHSAAYLAPTATVSGDVTIGPGCAILHGAIVTAEGAPVTIGANVVVMENAVLRSSGGKAMQWPLTVEDDCIIGPSAYVVGATLRRGCFIASGAKVFNGAIIESRVSVALGGIVQYQTHVRTGQHVPMQHIAWGDPAEVFPPEKAADVHAKMNFFEAVFNLPSGEDVRATAAQAYAKFLRKIHAQDALVEDAARKTHGPPRRTAEEPPQQQTADVEGVVDAMMLELQEMEARRQEALRKNKPK